MSSLSSMTKRPVPKLTRKKTKTRDQLDTIFVHFGFFIIIIYDFLNDFSKKC